MILTYLLQTEVPNCAAVCQALSAILSHSRGGGQEGTGLPSGVPGEVRRRSSILVRLGRFHRPTDRRRRRRPVTDSSPPSPAVPSRPVQPAGDRSSSCGAAGSEMQCVKTTDISRLDRYFNQTSFGLTC